MNKSSWLRTFFLAAACVAISLAPSRSLAQHGGGGHGGGGGFHGGGGGFHGMGGVGGAHYGYSGAVHGYAASGYRGGAYYGGGRGNYGGYRGGYGYGYHGGYGYGWYGGYGYPRYGYGWGWGWGLGFGFGWPYSGYPYGYYGYSPYYYSYPSYPPYYYCPQGYACPAPDGSSGSDDNSQPRDFNSPPQQEPPAHSSLPSADAPYTDPTIADVVTVYRSNAPVVSEDRITTTPAPRATGYLPASYQHAAASSESQPMPGPRPEVLSAIRALQNMPPYVREREIETGRYRDFSPEEKAFLRTVN